MNLIDEIFAKVIVGDAQGVNMLTAQAVEAGLGCEELLSQALIAPMTEIGQRFERGEVFVPEMLVAARAMKKGLEVLRPLLAMQGVQPLGTVLLGTVAGDLHDIGKNLVAMMLEGAGFKVIDLGIDVAPQTFVDQVQAQSPDILGMSALLTTTMPGMKITIDVLKEAGLREQVVVMVGGAPVTQRFADEIGADAYAPDASAAARMAMALIRAREKSARRG